MKSRWASWMGGWKEWTRYTYRWECWSEVHLRQNQKNCGEVGGTHVLEFIAERFRRRSRRICLTIKNWNGNKNRLYMSDKEAGWVSKEFDKNHAHHFEDGVSAPGWQECGYGSSLYACGHLWVTSVLHLMERRNLRMTWVRPMASSTATQKFGRGRCLVTVVCVCFPPFPPAFISFSSTYQKLVFYPRLANDQDLRRFHPIP